LNLADVLSDLGWNQFIRLVKGLGPHSAFGLVSAEERGDFSGDGVDAVIDGDANEGAALRALLGDVAPMRFEKKRES
jgi:hypothetical protein